MPSNICGACWNPVSEKFGTLTDPAGKRWKICAECINLLWHLHDEDKEDAINQSDPQKALEDLTPRQLTQVLRELVLKFASGEPDETYT
jgi:hypothetical protein